MKLIEHVKRQGKVAKLHLQRHHKKYIFGILSVSLLVKGISLIVAHTLVHNLSFANSVVEQNENSNISTKIDSNELDENIDNTDEDEKNTENESDTEDENNNYNENDIDNNKDEIINKTKIDENFPLKNEENNETSNFNIDNDYTKGEGTKQNDETLDQENLNNIGTENENNSEANNNEQNNGNENTDDGNTTNNESTTNDESTTNNEDNTDDENLRNYGKSITDKGNNECDEGDLEILSPIEGTTVGKIFDITRKFTNDDCKDSTYTVRLRNSNEQYKDIFIGNYDTTGFRFNSTQLESDYFTGYKIAVVSNNAEILYWNAEGGEFTIDKKSPTLSNIKTNFSTKNKKLNIGDTITISFETDEELTGINVNILGQSALLEQKRGNKYTYTMDFSKRNTEGKVVYGIDYSDKIGNTGYYEGYENIELDYTNPTIDKFEMINNGNYEIKITYTTNEETISHLVYILSGTDKTNSLDSTGKNNTFTLKNIKRNYTYNYSISIEDEAKNDANIGGTFELSGNNVVFTKKEITKGNLITEIGFRTGERREITGDLKQQFNSFDKCSEDINTIKLDLPIKGNTANVKMPKFSDQNVNKLTNAFSIVLVQRIEKKNLSQKALNEITEDLNNFLIVVKLVKDDNNKCKQNMTQYYTNRFKKTLLKYGIIE